MKETARERETMRQRQRETERRLERHRDKMMARESERDRARETETARDRWGRERERSGDAPKRSHQERVEGKPGGTH